MDEQENKWYFKALVFLMMLWIAFGKLLTLFLVRTGIKAERKPDVVDELIQMSGIDGTNGFSPAHKIAGDTLLVATVKRLNQILDSSSEATRAAQLLSMAAIIVSVLALGQSCSIPHASSELEKKQLELQEAHNDLLIQIKDQLTPDSEKEN